VFPCRELPPNSSNPKKHDIFKNNMTTVDLKMIEKMLDGSYRGQKRKLLNSNPEPAVPCGEDGSTPELSTPEFLHSGFWLHTVDGHIDRPYDGIIDGGGQLKAGRLMHRGDDRNSNPLTPDELSQSVDAFSPTSRDGDESEYQTLHRLALPVGLDW
jgi:hypothetical protein